jgi:hypothetical protein
MTDPNAAQARELLDALLEHVREITPRLVRAEQEGVHGDTSRSRAIRRVAGELRRDVSQAEFLIARLRRRYPGVDADRLSVAR